MKRYLNKSIKKRNKRKVLFVMLFVLLSLIFACIVFYKYNVVPIIVGISKEKVKSVTSDAVSQAVIDVMVENQSGEYIKIIRDEKNNIKSVSIDGEAVTVLAHKISLRAQQYINKIGTEGVKIPVGSLSGITFFTGRGPDINIKLYLAGSTHSRIVSSFTAGGINQTLHRLYFNINGDIAVAVPGIQSAFKTSAQVLMCETVIIGEIPPTYLNSTTIGDMLDLVPH